MLQQRIAKRRVMSLDIYAFLTIDFSRYGFFAMLLLPYAVVDTGFDIYLPLLFSSSQIFYASRSFTTLLRHAHLQSRHRLLADLLR